MTTWIRNVTGTCPVEPNISVIWAVRCGSVFDDDPWPASALHWDEQNNATITHFSFPEGTECPWMECPPECPVDGWVMVEVLASYGGNIRIHAASTLDWLEKSTLGSKWRVAVAQPIVDVGPVPRTFELYFARKALSDPIYLADAFSWKKTSQGYEFWRSQAGLRHLSPEARAILLHWIAEVEGKESSAPYPVDKELPKRVLDLEFTQGGSVQEAFRRFLKGTVPVPPPVVDPKTGVLTELRRQLAGKDAEITRLRALLAGKPLDVPPKPFTASSNLALGPMNVGVGSSYGDRR